jgi:glycosyltransferase involved in cell wall biosynthesis
MKKQTLSVVLATKNEQENIVDCLKSVKPIADEIIVFDESSTDKTRELAKKHGAKVFKTKHEPIFHITKNKAIKKAKSDWILQLDADERLTSGLRREIAGLLSGKYFGLDSWISPLKKFLLIFPKPQKLTEPAAAYWLPRRNFFLGRYLKHAGQYPDPVIRLLQKGKAILPAKDVHEQMKVKGRVGWMGSDLDHLATPRFERYLKRENSYSNLEAQHLYDRGVQITFFNTLSYLFFKPLKTFLSLYLRYRGILDGFPGFVFSLYSGFHHAFSYMKLWEIYKNKNGKN